MAEIIPAILTDNPLVLGQRLRQVKPLTDWVQIDIMDGRFVTNTSIQLNELFEFKTDVNYEAHLMVYAPEKYFMDCQKAGINRVVFHIEATDDVQSVLNEMDRYDFEKAIALNPSTPVESPLPYIDKVDAVLVLSVEPGFSAQEFAPSTLDKVVKLKQIAPEKKIGLDGGINQTNIKVAASSGADYLVIGSAIFKSSDVRQTYLQLKEMVNN